MGWSLVLTYFKNGRLVLTIVEEVDLEGEIRIFSRPRNSSTSIPEAEELALNDLLCGSQGWFSYANRRSSVTSVELCYDPSCSSPILSFCE